MMNKTILLFALLVSIGCKKDLKPLEKDQKVQYTTLNAEFCEKERTTFTGSTHYIFNIDGSTSSTANDPGEQQRILPILDWVDNSSFIENEDLFSLNVFSDDAKQVIPFVDKDRFSRDVRNVVLPNQGFSNLMMTIQASKMAIETEAKKNLLDARKFNKKSKFVVFLITDGYPTENGNRMDAGSFVTAVEDLVNLKLRNDMLYIEEIVVHAMYYYGNPFGTDGASDPEAEALMRDIAKAGNGQFVEFGNVLVNYSNFEIPKASIIKTLSFFYARPLGLVWNEQEKMLDQDRDLDGLSDGFEAIIGSDPNKADSDGNGIGDKVEYTVYGKPCQTDGCPRDSTVNPLCLSAVEDPAAPDPVFLDRDNDGLNGCEEKLLNSSDYSVDTNANFISDSIEFYAGLNLIQPDSHLLDSDGDGIADIDELRNFGSHLINNSLVKSENYRPISYKVVNKSNSKRTCFELQVEDIPSSEQELDLVLEFAMADPSITDDTYFYRANIKYKLGDKLELKDSDFKKLGVIETP